MKNESRPQVPQIDGPSAAEFLEAEINTMRVPEGSVLVSDAVADWISGHNPTGEEADWERLARESGNSLRLAKLLTRRDGLKHMKTLEGYDTDAIDRSLKAVDDQIVQMKEDLGIFT